MKPGNLQAASFSSYPQSARTLAVADLPLLRAMPLSLALSYLVQIQEYPTLFPVEQERLRLQLAALAARPALMDAFRVISVPETLEREEWVARPGRSLQALSGALWQTGQIDAYHRAAEALFAALPKPERASTAPVLLVAMGRGAAPGSGYPLFSRLRKEGLYLRRVDEAGAAEAISGFAAAQAHRNPREYAHWYVDGGSPWAAQGGVERFTFPALAPVRDAVLREMDRAVREGTGPELLAERMRGLPPSALGLAAVTGDPRLGRFLVSLLTQGSGTQLYSTSFVQAGGVELIRRARPETLLLRFAPRRKPANMNDMLDQRAQSVELDPDGALVDADMAVYYAWLALRKQDERASLVAWVEGHGEGFVVGPGVTRGVESTTAVTMRQALALIAA